MALRESEAMVDSFRHDDGVRVPHYSKRTLPCQRPVDPGSAGPCNAIQEPRAATRCRSGRRRRQRHPGHALPSTRERDPRTQRCCSRHGRRPHDGSVPHGDRTVGEAATRGSCVTTTTAAPSVLAVSTSSSITSSAATESSEPGRLVGEDDPRPRDQRPREGDPLALPAGELAGQPVARARPGPGGSTTPPPAARQARRGRPASSSGSAMFSTAGSSGTSCPNWNTRPKAVAPQLHALPVGEPVDALAVEVHLARVGSQDAGEAVQQRRLAGAARPHHRDDLPLVDGDAGARAAPAWPVRLVQLTPDQDRGSSRISSRQASPGATRCGRASAGPPRCGTAGSRRAERPVGTRVAARRGQRLHRRQVLGPLRVEVTPARAGRTSAPARPW